MTMRYGDWVRAHCSSLHVAAAAAAAACSGDWVAFCLLQHAAEVQLDCACNFTVKAQFTPSG